MISLPSHPGRVETPTSHLVVNNQSFVDDDGIRESWATYFESLATPDWVSSNSAHIET